MKGFPPFYLVPRFLSKQRSEISRNPASNLSSIKLKRKSIKRKKSMLQPKNALGEFFGFRGISHDYLLLFRNECFLGFYLRIIGTPQEWSTGEKLISSCSRAYELEEIREHTVNRLPSKVAISSR